MEPIVTLSQIQAYYNESNGMDDNNYSNADYPSEFFTE